MAGRDEERYVRCKGGREVRTGGKEEGGKGSRREGDEVE